MLPGLFAKPVAIESKNDICVLFLDEEGSCKV